MKWLISSDLHLTDQARDAYRFDIFPWLAQQQQRFNVDATFILGDITDQKDNHSSALVNCLIDELTGLRPPVYILKGNHDFIDPNNPFFRFLNCIEGAHFIVEPTLIDGVAMIPHQQDQASFDRACGIIPPKAPGVMVHATFNGALAETGARLTGLQATPIEAMKPLGTWAGDVHRPQRSGIVTYVGAPYHVRFGDTFTPRVLLVKNGVEQNLYFPAPHKWALTVRDAVEITSNEDLRAGDQVKVTVELAKEEVVEWAKNRAAVVQACKEMQLEVYGIELKVKARRRERVKLGQGAPKNPFDVLNAFCANENLPTNIKKAGVDLLKE